MIENLRYLFDKNIKDKYKVKLVSGSYEVGRSAMAGPIVVASVILKLDYSNLLIRDSKLLSEKQREKLYDEIIDNCISYSICEYDSEFVDKFNPKQTSRIGMIETIKNLKVKPEFCLIDGESIELPEYKCLKIIKGDNLSLSIAAASILAKVYKDRIMINYHSKYPDYNFIKHKGYCTIEHQLKVQQFGILNFYRLSYKLIMKIKGENNEFWQK
ncbi:ribonuclease HII [Spiroplasma taiwanense]|uniref:Ribonuclease n=1 Tax=Spiroplasma taiwanense CT-1 TaxID=1276220 RepID=S5LWG6_9MOLU|nr:ribonuclease HII [Spiroplasma taiwanense]AGR40971.1 ribonuclease HII [Spiroplasma taiwanense CT-1]